MRARAPIWIHVFGSFLLAFALALLFSFPIIFHFVYPVMVPVLERWTDSQSIAMLAGLIASVAVIVIGMWPAQHYLASARLACANPTCPGTAALTSTRPVTYTCATCGDVRKAWFSLRQR